MRAVGVSLMPRRVPSHVPWSLSHAQWSPSHAQVEGGAALYPYPEPDRRRSRIGRPVCPRIRRFLIGETEDIIHTGVIDKSKPLCLLNGRIAMTSFQSGIIGLIYPCKHLNFYLSKSSFVSEGFQPFAGRYILIRFHISNYAHLA